MDDSALNKILQARKEILSICRAVLINQYDLLKASKNIYYSWNDAKLDKDDSYYFFTGLVSELEEDCNLDLFKENNSNIVINETRRTDYISEHSEFIKQVCQELIDKYSI